MREHVSRVEQSLDVIRDRLCAINQGAIGPGSN
ncbi:hypothetical protein PIGHUM_00365 [Pigmentiphaga humi]|uniref:Uncharacterized protein n=1 Tax=Pigmentiphaga humi TaxID=2478468 RepID=A0A3P4AW90_9BURK|nr:hypothetical protein PIGHUM_00365 [Pigmentiphaga humi]